MKEPTTSQRDVTAGQPLDKVVKREKGYFYFVTADGSVQRVQQAYKPLTEEERRQRALDYERHRVAVRARQRAREEKRKQRTEQREALKTLKTLERNRRLVDKINQLRARINRT